MSVSKWSILKSLKLLSTEAKGNFPIVICNYSTLNFHVYYLSSFQSTVNILFVLLVRMSTACKVF